MKGKKILVIGESCKDIFVYCETTRLCPDVPVPVLNVIDQSENGGMAKNVQINIKSLVSSCDLITNPNWHTLTKTRYVHKSSNHTFFRVDTTHEVKRIDLQICNLDYDLVVISDYNKGFLLEDDIESICNRHPNVFLDTKKKLGSWAKKAKFIKINNYEYLKSKEYIENNLSDIVIHTDGANGAIFQNKTYPVRKVEVKDSSGAGDSFMAGLACKYLETRDIVSAIKFANECASEVVKHRGVSII